MTPPTYRTSLRIRLSTLFSPMRLVLGIASFAWFIVLSVLYLSRGQGSDVWGPLSVIPFLTFVAWTVGTVIPHRRDDTAPDDD